MNKNYKKQQAAIWKIMRSFIAAFLEADFLDWHKRLFSFFGSQIVNDNKRDA